MILNPSRVVKSAHIKAYLLYGKQGIIAETGQTDPVLNTVNLPLSLIKLNIAWNINPANSSSFPFTMKIVRSDSIIPAYFPYNSFVLNFAVQTSTPANMKIRVNLDLMTEPGAVFLIGSISETLPSYDSNTKVSCVLISNDDSKRKIQCIGVGTLVSTAIYQIGFKM